MLSGGMRRRLSIGIWLIPLTKNPSEIDCFLSGTTKDNLKLLEFSRSLLNLPKIMQLVWIYPYYTTFSKTIKSRRSHLKSPRVHWTFEEFRWSLVELPLTFCTGRVSTRLRSVPVEVSTVAGAPLRKTESEEVMHMTEFLEHLLQNKTWVDDVDVE